MLLNWNSLNNFPMRLFISVLFCLLAVTSLRAVDYSEYARLLDLYAEPTGVRYSEWAGNKADVSALNDFIDRLAIVDVKSLSKDEQKAFYINLYNAAMLQAVFKEYPIRSVTKIGLIPFSIFKKDLIAQGNRKLSLDDVEKGILLKNYFDARIHFAVNCASVSCPPLRAEPFVAEKLDSQLDEQTRLFANTEHAARVDREKQRIAYSSLFKWYKDDFAVENPAAYLNDFREEQLPLDYKTDWIDYDWGLNAAN